METDDNTLEKTRIVDNHVHKTFFYLFAFNPAFPGEDDELEKQRYFTFVLLREGKYKNKTRAEFFDALTVKI